MRKKNQLAKIKLEEMDLEDTGSRITVPTVVESRLWEGLEGLISRIDDIAQRVDDLYERLIAEKRYEKVLAEKEALSSTHTAADQMRATSSQQISSHVDIEHAALEKPGGVGSVIIFFVSLSHPF